MNSLTIEGWYKKSGAERPIALEQISFYVSDECHLMLERAEEELRKTHASEKFVDVDMQSLNLHMPSEVGRLADCQMRVYLDEMDHRGQFHLVGHRAIDNSLVYTNPVMVDQLG